jgi:hypothetical protein
VLNAHQVLRTALGDAERQGLVTRNVARMIDPPCYGTAPEQSCWNQEELRAFLRAAAAHRLAPALWLSAMTGMRRGEVLGLRWSDIDLAARRLSLQRSVTCTGYKVHTTPTKTRTSRRTIDLDATTVGVLVDWRAAQARELGDGDHGTDDAAEQGGAALPDPQRLERSIGVVAEMVQEVGEPGADERAHDGPGEEPPQVGLVDAAGRRCGAHQLGAGQEPDARADPVRRHGQWAQLDLGDRRVLQERECARHCWVSW